MSSSEDRISALERRIDELHSTVARLLLDYSSLQNCAVYTYGALVELSVEGKIPKETLERIGETLDEMFARHGMKAASDESA